MRIKGSVFLSVVVSLVAGTTVCRAQLPDVPEAAIEALGKTPGTKQSNGFVFVEGRYIAPPYTVSRKGNGIFINRVQVEQPFAWTAETLTPASTTPSEKKLGESVVTGNAEKETNGTEVRAQDAAEAQPREAPAGKTLDALFDEGPATSVAEAKPGGVPEKQPAAVILTQKQKDELRQKLEIMRLRFEMGLAQGEIFLFNYKYGRINGTYGTAKILFAVLPEAVRYANSPQDLMSRLNQGGVSFLDIDACSGLYRNKTKFMALSARREAIETK